MKNQRKAALRRSAGAVGHLAAMATILIWGTTFISTKVLLTAFTPVEILLCRFAIGFAALCAVCPRRMRGTTRRQELTMAAAGLCGVCLYYLLENVALTLTLASNVGVILSVAPFFTALLSRRFLHEGERPGPGFWGGFVLAMAGICLLAGGFSAGAGRQAAGDLLALLAALVWACYSVFSKKIAAFGQPTALTTRRVFFYGLLFLLPAAAKVRPSPALLVQPVYLANLLFLGLGASALCFVTWNVAVQALGAVKTSVYIYLVPVITMAASSLLLGETLTPAAVFGAALALAGLALSEYAPKPKRETKAKRR